MSKISNIYDRATDTLSHDMSPFSKQFYMKHLGKILIVTFLLYCYEQLRYQYDEAIFRLGQLKTELSDARYTSIAKWGELTSKSKPELVKSQISENAHLIPANEPPYILK